MPDIVRDLSGESTDLSRAAVCLAVRSRQSETTTVLLTRLNRDLAVVPICFRGTLDAGQRGRCQASDWWMSCGAQRKAQLW
jgi:hypothetical protein